ncbi:glycoside hydrolase family 6 protein [Nocardioides sp. URHA0032]|uniref:glycoside hydrolase family 6 protein n=1 Tax=Nocardioides sp. URHA0032 TaxID=1380388 RepID=UPI0012DE0C93|nr:glycoside hydrolase family 6 protein [Nocardioides sp. URHA0032]
MLPRSVSTRAVALLGALALGVVGLVAPSAADPVGHHVVAKTDPRKKLGLFVDPKMPAYQQGGAYRQEIGSRAQAFWVIPEAYDTSHVKDKILEYTGDAAAARKTPVLTIYGIPGRDCGQYSSGNPFTTAAQYRGWIKQIAAGLRGTRPLVILEPDALPLFSSSVQSCPTKPDGWQAMLRYASRKLSSAGAWVYLDAGHSNWTPYDTRPKYLKAAGVAFDRGFSTNVSNFRPLADEKAYAAKMLRGLRKLGITGKHYVVDTSRNGAAPPDGSGYDVINPTWARLGRAPRLLFDGAFDGTLWVKHPGESDGQVNGGGPSGRWCDMLADRLIDGTSDQGSCP